MAKTMYVGINGVARKVKAIYVGVDGVARKVKSGYVGVGGVAKQFWAGDRGELRVETAGKWGDYYVYPYKITVTDTETGKCLEFLNAYGSAVITPSRIGATYKLGYKLSNTNIIPDIIDGVFELDESRSQNVTMSGGDYIETDDDIYREPAILTVTGFPAVASVHLN